jgi:hypothetical protein
LTKNARSTYAELPQPVKHFNLIRLAKSATLIQDLKQKAINFSKSKKPSVQTSNEKHVSVPYMSRNMSKSAHQTGNDAKSNANSSATIGLTPGFLKRSYTINPTLTGKSSALKRDTGIKVNF